MLCVLFVSAASVISVAKKAYRCFQSNLDAYHRASAAITSINTIRIAPLISLMIKIKETIASTAIMTETSVRITSHSEKYRSLKSFTCIRMHKLSYFIALSEGLHTKMLNYSFSITCQRGGHIGFPKRRYDRRNKCQSRNFGLVYQE